MKRIILVAVILIVVFGGVYAYLKSNPPLETGTLGTSSDRHHVTLEIGNKNIVGDIHIEDVLINSNVRSDEVKIQVSNPLKGFIIADVSDGVDGPEESEYTFKSIQDVSIASDTGPESQLDKVYGGTATEKDKSYAITVSHDNAVVNLTIIYRYLGITYEEDVALE